MPNPAGSSYSTSATRRRGSKLAAVPEPSGSPGPTWLAPLSSAVRGRPSAATGATNVRIVATAEGTLPAPQRLRMLMLHHSSRQGHRVVGESHRQKQIQKIAGRLGDDGPKPNRRRCVVDLVPEPKNRHDPNAIAVMHSGKLLGYVPAEDTGPYHEFIAWAQSNGWEGVSCRARITGGFILHSGERAHLGIELMHTTPLMIAYDGPLPIISDEEDSNRINLQGEERCQPVLADLQRRRVLAHLVVDTTGVRVAVDGQIVGHLTKKMTERYGELILREQSRSNGTATCMLIVRSGPTKLEAAVKLPGHEGLQAWARELRDVSVTQPSEWPAAWRPDPTGVARMRYYDGSTWTDQTEN